ncbi:MAG: putative motility protein, partial [Pseudomonadota bacterium]
DIAAASLEMQRASMGQAASLMMLKQAAHQAQAIAQVIQAAQATLPPPSAPHLGTTLDIVA